jgi:hypothetical protein
MTLNEPDSSDWPAQYIVDQRGNVVFSHAGEGQYDEIERTVRRLLNATS